MLFLLTIVRVAQPADAATWYFAYNDTRLIMFRAEESIGERGIYRYDPEAETYTPLLEDVSLLYALPHG